MTTAETNPGTTSGNTEKEQMAWYVLRSTFNRSQKAYDLLTSNSFHAYLPLKMVEKVVKGRLKRIMKPLIPNLLFVYSKEDELKEFVKANKDTGYITLYYDHFSHSSNGTNKLLTVPDFQMDNFIRATSKANRHMMVVDPKNIRFKSGDQVRIVEGDFIGVVGKVARVGGQSRVIVTLEGVCSIATAYIPSAFLEPYQKC